MMRPNSSARLGCESTWPCKAVGSRITERGASTRMRVGAAATSKDRASRLGGKPLTALTLSTATTSATSALAATTAADRRRVFLAWMGGPHRPSL